MSLRPEFTTSVIRSYLEDKDQYSIPIKRQYVGPVFRYQPFFNQHSFRQFTQQGCELIGLDDINSDALILRLSLMGLAESGISSVVVKIGHVGFIRQILKKYDLTDAMELFVLSHLNDLADPGFPISDILDEAYNIGFISDNQTKKFNSVPNKKWTYDSVKATFKDRLSGNLGRRTHDQVIDRFLAKTAEDSITKDTFSSVLNDLSVFIIKNNFIVSEDISVESDLTVKTYINSILEEVGIIENLDVKYKVDFAIQRGLTYYTGLIFDLEGEGKWTGKTLGGGGRYDGLVKSMGNDINLPAIGFAMNIESILECVKN